MGQLYVKEFYIWFMLLENKGNSADNVVGFFF